MSYHYSRDPGEQGTIHTVDGNAPGMDLATLLQSGRPPLRACLQIGSAIADILTIAEEDRAVHGDIKPGDVTVLASGAVAVDGYGYSRRTTRAPEGRPEGSLSDVFGLGVVMHSLLSDQALGMLPRDPDAHDDAVVDRVMEMDFGGLEGKRWMDDARRFLCTIMAYDPQERPAPLDAANVLARIANQAPGTDLQTWAAQALGRGQAPQAPQAPAQDPHEALGGPRNLGAPMPQGQALETRQAPASKGQTTQMWTRERLAAFIEEDAAEDSNWDLPAPTPAPPPQAVPPPPPTTPAAEDLPGPRRNAPVAGGWDPQGPSGWDPAAPPRSPRAWEQEPGTRPQGPRSPTALPGLEPPPLGQTGFDPAPPRAPAPPRPPVASPRPPAPPPQRPAPPAPPRAAAPPPPPNPVIQGRVAPSPPAPPAPPSRPAPPPPRPAPAPPRAAPPRPPAGPPPAGRAPGRPAPPPADAPPPPVAWSPDEEPAAEEKKSSPLKYVLIGGVVLFLLCAGITGISAAIFYFTQPDGDRGDPIVHANEDEDPHERVKTPEIVDTGSAVDAKPTPLETAKTPEPAPVREAEPSRTQPSGSTRSPSGSGTTRSGSSTGGSASAGSGSSRSTGSSGSTRSGSSSGSSGSQTSSSGSSSGTAEVEPTPVVLPNSAYEVKISLPSKKKATLRCGDGQSNKFSSAVRMEFKGTVTCVVEADGARGAITVDRGGRVSCGITGEDIFCSGPS